MQDRNKEPELLAATLGGMLNGGGRISQNLTRRQESSSGPLSGPPGWPGLLVEAKHAAGHLWATAGLPERSLHVLSVTPYPSGVWLKTRDSILEKCLGGGTVLLYGRRKTGKTVMAVDVMVRLLALNRKLGRYVRGLGLLQDLRRKHNENDAAIVAATWPYYRWPVLVIDEVGVRTRADMYSDSDGALLTDLVDHRYQGMTGTILISNESRDDTMKILGPSIARRIDETGLAVEATWPVFQGTV